MVEDNKDDSDLILRQLRHGGLEPEFALVDSQASFKLALESRQWDLVLSDFELVGFNGIEALLTLRSFSPDLPLIIVSGVIGEETAVKTMKMGANDYIMKDNLARLVPAIERELIELENRRTQKEAVAALKEAEERLRQTEKMQAIGKLATGVAHDFNNLLTVIGMHCDSILKSTAPAGTVAPFHEDVVQIEKARERAARLTQQLLAFSRKRPVQPQPVEVRKVVLDLEEMLQRLIGDSIKLEVRSPEGGLVNADPNQVEQIIMNLVVNARDALPNGGKIEIQCRDVSIDPEEASNKLQIEPGRYLMLSVRDNGCGIDPEVRYRIFEPFFTTKDPTRGTGMGLATVHGIVRQNQGAISVESEPGKGTEFKIFLPRVASPTTLQPEATAASAHSDAAKKDATVLLAEDEDILRNALTRTLMKEGYQIIPARDGQEAIEMFQKHSRDLDLLVTDFVMPGIDGQKLTAEVLSRRSDLKVLFLSGYGEAAFSELRVEKARTRFLEKPFTTDTFVQQVNELLSLSVS